MVFPHRFRRLPLRAWRRGGRLMGIMVWLLIGAALGAMSAWRRRFAFPAGRPACLLGGMAGAFLGGGTLTAATGASQAGFHAPSSATAVAGALAVIAAVGWAGGADYPQSPSRDGRNRSAR